MENKYEKLRQTILSLDFGDITTLVKIVDTSQCNQRTHAIHGLLKTESIYLERICTLLKESFMLLDKKVNNRFLQNILNKKQIVQLFCNFPSIYDLHISLYRKLNVEIEFNQLIGKVLCEFLSQRKLLEVYENYIENFSEILPICKLIEAKSEDKCIVGLEQVIVCPIQKFPQLSMVISDIYKLTPCDNDDIVNLSRALYISKSITAKLDLKRKHYEYIDYGDVEKTLTKLGLKMLSSKVLSTHSVNLIKLDSSISSNVIKIPYSLMLCNHEVILIPKFKRFENHSIKSTFCYDLNTINLDQETISNFIYFGQSHDSHKCMIDFETDTISYCDIKRLKEIFFLANNSDMDDIVFDKYRQILCDQNLLEKCKSCLQRRNNCEYLSIDVLDKTLMDLEQECKVLEEELNLTFNLMLSIKHKKVCSSLNKKIILFDSLKIIDEWKRNFNRVKLLSIIQIETDWLYHNANTDFRQLESYELPLVFQPFQLKKSRVFSNSFDRIKYQIVNIVVSSVICRCLWICLPTGQMTILHFDYKQWNILESFNTSVTEPVIDTCTYTNVDINHNEITDSEIWIASNNKVFIHSLVTNRNAISKEILSFSTKIKSLCNIENTILVAFEYTITIYKKDENMLWKEGSIISLKSFLLSNEGIKKIQYGNKLVYIVCENKIIIYEFNGKKFDQKHIFTSNDKINLISLIPDGVWASFKEQKSIILFDKNLKFMIFTISIPSQIISLGSTGNITSLYANDKYIWIGTDTGCIICVSTVDSGYCVDSNVPMYFFSKRSSKLITEFTSFENIRSMPFKMSNKESSEDNNSNDDNSNSFDNLSVTTFDYSTKDEVDCVSDRSLKDVYKNWNNCPLTLMLAFGTGISKIDNDNEQFHSNSEKQNSYDHLPTIFTFFQ